MPDVADWLKKVPGAKEKSHSMAMINPNIKALRDEFNNIVRALSDTTFDLVLNSEYQWTNTLALNAVIVIKQRKLSRTLFMATDASNWGLSRR